MAMILVFFSKAIETSASATNVLVSLGSLRALFLEELVLLSNALRIHDFTLNFPKNIADNFIHQFFDSKLMHEINLFCYCRLSNLRIFKAFPQYEPLSQKRSQSEQPGEERQALR